MTIEELEKEIQKKQRLAQLESLEANKFRAQSITIGTAGGGTTEITMRSNGGNFLWNTYQPVEVIELINQMAAGIGCHIHITPREDFASWRYWKDSDGKKVSHQKFGFITGVGHPPFPQIKNEREEIPDPEIIKKFFLEKETQEKENVATKKAVNKRSTKRSRTSSK